MAESMSKLCIEKAHMVIYCDFDNPSNFSTSKSFFLLKHILCGVHSAFISYQSFGKPPVCVLFSELFSSSPFFFDKLASEVPCLVKELPQGLVALPLVADFSSGNAAGARADVGRAVLLTCVIQVAGLGSIQAVILSGHCWLAYR